MHRRIFQVVNNRFGNLINARLQRFEQTSATDYGIEVVEFDPLFAKLVENDAQTEIVLIENRFVGGQLLARMAYGDLGDGLHVAVKTHLGRGRSWVDN